MGLHVLMEIHMDNVGILCFLAIVDMIIVLGVGGLVVVVDNLGLGAKDVMDTGVQLNICAMQ